MLCKAFLNYLQVEKSYSKYTLESYERDLSKLKTFLNEIGCEFDPYKLTHYHVRAWITSMLEHGQTARTVNRRISSLQTFYVFLQRKLLINYNPIDKVIRPKTIKKVAPFVRDKDMDHLLDKVIFPSGEIGKRDHLIIEIFYLSGIRLAELIGLKISDVDFKKSQLKVIGKRNQQRIVPVGAHLMGHIEDYLKLKDIPSVYLFSSKGSHLTRSYVYRVVSSYLKQVSTIERKSPHVLRHSFATVLLNNGANMNAIKELLGHKDLTSTEIYTHNTTKRISDIYRHAHPRA